MNRFFYFLFCFLFWALFAVACAAEGKPVISAPPSPQVLQNLLPRAEKILQHQAELHLSSEQVGRIREQLEMQKLPMRSRAERLQQTSAHLRASLANDANEEDVLEEVRAIAALESELKVEHARLLLQVRSLLSAEQRRLLHTL